MSTMGRPITTKKAAAPAAAAPTKRNGGISRGDIEKWLDDRGAQYELYTEISIELIDVARSLKNQARVESPLIQPQVDTYAEAMERGDKFPPIVLYPIGSDKYVVVDGNHRVAGAIEAGLKGLPAYVLDVKTPAALVTILTFEANTRHGMPASREDRAQHAIFLIRNASETVKNAAARMNLPEHYLSKKWSEARADERARRAKIPPGVWHDLSYSARTRLNTIGADESFTAAVNLAGKARLLMDDIEQLVRELRPIGSTAEQLALIQRWENEARARISAVATGDERPRRQVVTGPRQSLRSAVYMLDSLVADKRSQLLEEMSSLEAKEWAAKMRHAFDTYAEILDALEAKAREDA
jgi:hypothetical protein